MTAQNAVAASGRDMQERSYRPRFPRASVHNVRDDARRKESKPMDIFAGDPRFSGYRSCDRRRVRRARPRALVREWSAPTGGEIDRAVASKEFTGKLFETFLTPIVDRAYRARRLAAVGLGRQSDFTVDRARRAATAIGLTARQKKIARVAFRRARRARVAGHDSGNRRGADAGRVRRRALQDRGLRSVRADRRSASSSTKRVAGQRRSVPRAAVASSASTATWRGSSTTSRETR